MPEHCSHYSTAMTLLYNVLSEVTDDGEHFSAGTGRINCQCLAFYPGGLGYSAGANDISYGANVPARSPTIVLQHRRRHGVIPAANSNLQHLRIVTGTVI